MVRLCVALLLVALGPALAEARTYRPGEVWTYKTRAQDDGSRVRIGKVSQGRDGQTVYNVSLDRLNVRSPDAPGGVVHEVDHVAVSQDTLDASTRRLVGRWRPGPYFNQGYAVWRKAYDKNEASVWRVPLDEVVETMQKALAGE